MGRFIKDLALDLLEAGIIIVSILVAAGLVLGIAALLEYLQ